MTAAPNRIREIRTQKKITLEQLADDTGLSPGYIQRLESGKRNLSMKNMDKLAAGLKVPPRDILPAGIDLGAEAAAPDLPRNARIAGPAHFTDTIPVYGRAVGGADGRFLFNGERLADVLAPPVLTGVRDAYAVYVVGDSMEPRYHPGETVYVNPHKPPRRGDYVVVQIHGEEGEPPSGFVKRFVALDHRHLHLEQLNPPKRINVPAARVKSVHRIVMGGDG
jgi:phage repressor protein C with HTH and peptisase S24 domain